MNFERVISCPTIILNGLISMHNDAAQVNTPIHIYFPVISYNASIKLVDVRAPDVITPLRHHTSFPPVGVKYNEDIYSVTQLVTSQF